MIKNSFILFIIFALIPNYMEAQQETKDIKTALVIIDIQEFYFPGEGPGLVGATEASEVAKKVLETFREENLPVVHVRHLSKKGFDIHKNVLPLDNEKVITKKEVNSFNKTDLLDFLKENEINRLVLVGMQTHMCLEAATRAAYDYGFECIVIEDACATRDLKFGEKTVKAEDVHAATLATLTGGGYAKVLHYSDFEANPDAYLYQMLH